MRRERWWMVGITAVVAMMVSEPVYASGPLHKLARGVANVATGWVELPVQVVRTTELDGNIAGLTVGVAKGVKFGIGRTALGVWEIATFWLANYSKQVGSDSYGPLVEPEFVVIRQADTK